jgi:hypothetical protein
MKRKTVLSIILAVGLTLTLAACAKKPSSQEPQELVPGPEAASPSASPAGESFYQSKSSQTFANGVTVTKITEEVNGSAVQYITVSGLADAVTETKLNEDLYDFSTRDAGVQAGSADVTVVLSLKYAVVGDVLSVSRSDMVLGTGTQGAANYLRTQTYDLISGQICSLTDFVSLGLDILDLIEEGEFAQVYPGEISGANEKLAADIQEKHAQNPDYINTSFYLTNTSLGLYIDDDSDGGRGYWAFECPYDKLDERNLLIGELFDAVGGNAVDSGTGEDPGADTDGAEADTGNGEDPT